jgi:hypothetical protein
VTDHDPGDEDRRPAIRDYLDLLCVVDRIAIRRPEWKLVHPNPADDIMDRLLNEGPVELGHCAAHGPVTGVIGKLCPVCTSGHGNSYVLAEAYHPHRRTP